MQQKSKKKTLHAAKRLNTAIPWDCWLFLHISNSGQPLIEGCFYWLYDMEWRVLDQVKTNRVNTFPWATFQCIICHWFNFQVCKRAGVSKLLELWSNRELLHYQSVCLHIQGSELYLFTRTQVYVICWNITADGRNGWLSFILFWQLLFWSDHWPWFVSCSSQHSALLCNSKQMSQGVQPCNYTSSLYPLTSSLPFQLLHLRSQSLRNTSGVLSGLAQLNMFLRSPDLIVELWEEHKTPSWGSESPTLSFSKQNIPSEAHALYYLLNTIVCA